MNERIHINPEQLQIQLKALSDLKNSTELAGKIKAVSEGYITSSGKTANKINEINQLLLQISKQMQVLFARTYDFLSNTSTHFIEADNSVAKAVEQASITQGGGN